MPPKNLTAIVAATPNGTIGRDGDMPWQLSSDLRRFKRLTMGGIIIMGRRTFDSIGRPLPGRRTFVLTRDASWKHEGVATFCNPDLALASVGNQSAFVVGGAQIYAALMPHCQQVYLTRVWSQVAGDTQIDLAIDAWRCTHIERQPAKPRDSVPTEFSIWQRRTNE